MTATRGGRVVVVGSLNVDHVVDVEDLPRRGQTVLAYGERRFAGGKGGNQAVAAAAAGARVTMIGAVGDDDEGRAYRTRLERLGIEAALVVETQDVGLTTRAPRAPTGHAYITVDGAGENAIVVVPGANHQLSVEHLAAIDTVGAADVVLCQLEVPIQVVAAATRRAAARGARVVINCAPYAALPADVVGLADPLVCNELEAREFAQTGIAPASWLVTFGPAGCAWDGEQYVAPVVPAHEVVDTTGAGDAFCGALAAALARGAGRDQAVHLAMSAGAEAVRRRGAQPDPVI